MMQLKAKSDPISGSLGHPLGPEPTMNDEARLEWSLKQKKPVTFKIDQEEHPDTQRSLEWAEKHYGVKSGNPRIENVTETWQFIPANGSQDADTHVYDMDPE